MASNRKRSRVLLFQKLYAEKYNKFDETNFYDSFYNWVFHYDIDKEYIDEITEIIKKNESKFNEIIKKFAPKFNIESMSPIYILPIYIALSEIFYFSLEIPIKVSVNEAIEIAKNYSDDSWKKIVNWILNKVIENYEELKKEI